MGQTPGDLPPEELKKFPTSGARREVRKKTRAQNRERARVEINKGLDELTAQVSPLLVTLTTEEAFHLGMKMGAAR